MNQPWESVYVGAFIYTMGYFAAKAELPLNAAGATLLTQNPGDHLIGDLVADWEGRSAVIEFKRNFQSVATELKKPHRVRYLEVLASPGKHLLALAARGHFIGYGTSYKFEHGGQSYRSDLAMVQYHRIPELLKSQKPWGFSLGFFFDRLTSGRIGLAGNDWKDFYNGLKRMAAANSGSGNGRETDAGDGIVTLVVNYDEASKGLRFLAVDLGRDRTLQVGRDAGQDGQTPRHGRTGERDLDDEIPRGRGRGKGMGLGD